MSEKMELLLRRAEAFIAELEEESYLRNTRIFSDFNMAVIVGQLENELKYSHQRNGIKFYRTRVIAERVSGIEDYVPVMIPDRVLRQISVPNDKLKGKWVKIAGEFSSCNKIGEDGRRQLDLFLLVRYIEFCDEPGEYININLVELTGYICKPTVLRKTPLGTSITDIHIAINKSCAKSNYIPCITWNAVAEIASLLKVGERIKIRGRIQSRPYFKRVSPNSEEGIWKTAYEVSVARFDLI